MKPPDAEVRIAVDIGPPVFPALTWTRNTLESDIVKYRVYRDGNLVPLMEVQVVQYPSGELSTVEVIDWALTNERDYSYRIEAVDDSGTKSGLSEQVTASPQAGMEWGD